MLRFGPDGGPLAVVAMPLFEEANRVRAFAAMLCRALAKRGVASALPDLPGQGESLVALARCSILDIAGGFERAAGEAGDAGRPRYGVAIRSGALLDKRAALNGRWHFAPQDGPDLSRALKRIKQASLGPADMLGDPWYRASRLPEGEPDPP